MRFFSKPSELVEFENTYQQNYVCPYFAPLQGTLGWYELECDMFTVITRMAESHDDWLKSADISDLENHQYHHYPCGYPDIVDDEGFTRKFVEYFTFEHDNWYIASEPLIKIHRGIGRRTHEKIHFSINNSSFNPCADYSVCTTASCKASDQRGSASGAAACSTLFPSV